MGESLLKQQSIILFYVSSVFSLNLV